MRPRLFIFVKAPWMGFAKTRLAAGIGPVHAQRIYRAMTAKILRASRDPRWDSILYVAPGTARDQSFGGLWDGVAYVCMQGAGDLSDRLARIFTHKGPVIAIGTDAPQITACDIATGFRALKTRDAVLGPAADGGFWLIGFNGPVSTGVFENIRWSGQHARADICCNIDGQIAHLRTLTDIDTGQDLRALNV